MRLFETTGFLFVISLAASSTLIHSLLFLFIPRSHSQPCLPPPHRIPPSWAILCYFCFDSVFGLSSSTCRPQTKNQQRKSFTQHANSPRVSGPPAAPQRPHAPFRTNLVASARISGARKSPRDRFDAARGSVSGARESTDNSRSHLKLELALSSCLLCLCANCVTPTRAFVRATALNVELSPNNINPTKTSPATDGAADSSADSPPHFFLRDFDRALALSIELINRILHDLSSVSCRGTIHPSSP